MLTVQGISKRFGQRVVADALSLEVAAGEMVALLGPSGSGKSSLLNMIAGLSSPDAGTVTLNGEDLLAQPPEARHVAMIFQDFALFPHLDARDNAAFGLVERGMARKQARGLAEEALAEVGLSGQGHRRVWTLSGGEQQRVALARALVTSPRLMLLDEPFSSLDAHLREQMQAEFRQRLRSANIPALLVTHDRDEAFAMADKVAVLHQGRIVQCAAPAELLAASPSHCLACLRGVESMLDDGVLPQEALRVESGQPPARILSLSRQADGVRLEVEAVVGRLVLRLSAREAAALPVPPEVGGEIGLGVDLARMRGFAAPDKIL